MDDDFCAIGERELWHQFLPSSPRSTAVLRSVGLMKRMKATALRKPWGHEDDDGDDDDEDGDDDDNEDDDDDDEANDDDDEYDDDDAIYQ